MGKQWQTSYFGAPKSLQMVTASFGKKSRVFVGSLLFCAWEHFWVAGPSRVQGLVLSLSRVWLFATPWTVAYQAPLSMGFLGQEYWSGLPFPSPGESSWPRDQTWVSSIAGRCFPIWATREAHFNYRQVQSMVTEIRTVKKHKHTHIFCFLRKGQWTFWCYGWLNEYIHFLKPIELHT